MFACDKVRVSESLMTRYLIVTIVIKVITKSCMGRINSAKARFLNDRPSKMQQMRAEGPKCSARTLIKFYEFSSSIFSSTVKIIAIIAMHSCTISNTTALERTYKHKYSLNSLLAQESCIFRLQLTSTGLAAEFYVIIKLDLSRS